MNIHVTLPGGECPRTFELKGRLGWTIAQLAKAGHRGVTTIECTAPRWSGYIHDLRKLGFPIETEMEPHGGTYEGRHARYRLACDVRLRPANGPCSGLLSDPSATEHARKGGEA